MLIALGFGASGAFKASGPSAAGRYVAGEPTEAEVAALLFAWKVVKHVKSNAVVLVRDGRTIGIGAGQMSRVDSVEIAVRKAGDRAQGAVMASDAFFPFRDAVEAAVNAGNVIDAMNMAEERD